jgi:Fe-S-cluster containining protein
MYPCTKCGCCCRKVGLLFNDNQLGFPYRAKENGECEMLENNKCKVYDNRPTICNIDKIIEILRVDKEEYYKKNIQACNKIMDDENISIECRIK